MYDVDGRDRIHIEYLVIVPANVNVNEDILKKIYHINSGVCSGHSYLVPATYIYIYIYIYIYNI